MPSTDDVLLEDWQGLESELERLFMIYGYPVGDLQETRDQEGTEARAIEEDKFDPGLSGSVVI